MICAHSDRTVRREKFRLSGRHARQLAMRSDEKIREDADLIAVSFRPGDRTDTFYDKTLRPLGAAVCVALTYDAGGREILLSGVRAAEGTFGNVRYGAGGQREFQYDVRPAPNNQVRHGLSVRRNPSLVDLALRMDMACQRRAEGRLPVVPRMPRILLGFSRSDLPRFESTDGLRRRAASQLGISVQKLATNPPELVDRLLRQTWDGVLAESELKSVDSGYGLLLIDAEYCPSVCRPLRIFEDFSDLVGDWTWNPVRGLEILEAANPAREFFEKYGIPTGSLDSISQGTLDGLLQEMRGAFGDGSRAFDDEDLLDALVEPDEPVVACSILLPKMRQRLTEYWNTCVLDRDLRRATRYSHEPLYAAGACRIQVLRRDPGTGRRFTSADLGCRIEIDLARIEWTRRRAPGMFQTAATGDIQHVA